MVTGAVTVIGWKNLSGGLFDLYEILPGFLLCALAAIVVSLLDKEPAAEIQAQFDSITT
jgi:sodium/proline symporter